MWPEINLLLSEASLGGYKSPRAQIILPKYVPGAGSRSPKYYVPSRRAQGVASRGCNAISDISQACAPKLKTRDSP